MKHAIYIFYWIIGLLTISCSTNESGRVDFDESSFAEKHLLKDGRFLFEDTLDLELLDPRWIRYHPDSFLVLQELRAPELIKIIDLKTLTTQSLVKSGRGPKEVISGWGIFIVGKDIWLYDAQKPKLLRLAKSDNRTFKVAEQVKINALHLTPPGFLNADTNYIGLLYNSKHRLSMYNPRGDLIKQTGTPPHFQHDNKSKPELSTIFRSTISASPDGQRIVLGCENTDIIEIYDFDKGFQKRFHGPFGHKFHVETTKSGNLTGQKVRPSLRAYRNAIGTEKGFYIGYNGLYKENKKQITENSRLIPKHIFYFSWEGNPLKHYELDSSFRSFDFSTNKEKLFCITLTPAPKIMVYDFPN
ncbi:BF3164 family lipoprotein [Marinilabilia rubra]|uniref:6-bladed beta-propeller n=1 Tax=Marinilabilia rubra TaxID=2162893 RepID=A0A2U2B7H1_9BACT|nr:BF3164 family lipoprotein [Marinilabilia rubra]PWD99031.1 hypothetical protein DDZ16_12255 [Marinilabilia rubra]